MAEAQIKAADEARSFFQLSQLSFHGSSCKKSWQEPIFKEYNLQREFASAIYEVGLWPRQLFDALQKSKLLGRGLLIFSVDARRLNNTGPKLQTPILEDPLLGPLCRWIQENPKVAECNNNFQTHMPQKAAMSMQFVPADFWKAVVEPMLNYRVPRKRLKTTTTIEILGAFQAPQTTATGKWFLMEMNLARPGAVLANEAAAAITEEQKAFFWESMQPRTAPEAAAKHSMLSMGLDPAALHGVPLFDQLWNDFAEHLQQAERTEAFAKLQFLEAWYPTAIELAERYRAWETHLHKFFEKKHAEVNQLRDFLGSDRVAAAMQAAHAADELDDARAAHYAAHFSRRLSRPCPACGKPLQENSRYTCGCQRPALPQPQRQPAAAAAERSKTADTTNNFMARRSANTQTAFSLKSRPKSKKHGSKPEIEAEPVAVHPENRRPPSVQKQKPAKETDRAMILLREQVSQHLSDERQQGDEASPCAASTRSTRRTSATRKSRRRAPQGDRKLASMMTAGQILFPEQSRDGYSSRP